MLKQNIRLRKEYLYSKSKEAKQLQDAQQKLHIRNAIESEQRIQIKDKKKREELTHEMELDDDKTLAPRTHIDDEYEEAKYRDPKLLMTTSRNSSQRLMQFLKEMKLILPNSVRINRGSYVLKDLVKIA